MSVIYFQLVVREGTLLFELKRLLLSSSPFYLTVTSQIYPDRNVCTYFKVQHRGGSLFYLIYCHDVAVKKTNNTSPKITIPLQLQNFRSLTSWMPSRIEYTSEGLKNKFCKIHRRYFHDLSSRVRLDVRQQNTTISSSDSL